MNMGEYVKGGESSSRRSAPLTYLSIFISISSYRKRFFLLLSSVHPHWIFSLRGGFTHIPIRAITHQVLDSVTISESRKLVVVPGSGQ